MMIIETTQLEPTGIKPIEYTCVICGGVFLNGWSEEEANAEFAKNYPSSDINDTEVVCDDCYKLIEKER